MDFTKTPKGEGGVYEKPKPGKYLGVLIGFAYVGNHTGQFGSKPKVLLRWELHKRKGPSLDSQGQPHTITAPYGATLRGPQSLLNHCIEAHVGRIEEGQTVRSQDWLGKAAWLDLEETDKGYINVKTVSPLDPEDDETPKPIHAVEHWDLASVGEKVPPPQWAHFWLSRSDDLGHLAPERGFKVPVTAGAGTMSDGDIPF